MAKDPAVLFYTSDFISGTITMTDEQRGKYILLLCIQHQKGKLTEKDMLNICKAYDEDIWSKFKKDGEYYYNERMKFEAEKRAKYAESRRNNRVKKENKKNNDEHMNNICKTYDKHMENENENENIDINKEGVQGEKNEPISTSAEQPSSNRSAYPFDEFWNDYDKKVGDKVKIRKKYEKLSDKDKLKIKENIPKYKAAQPEKQFRKNPETYLNNKSWNDEIIARVQIKSNHIEPYTNDKWKD